MGVEQKAVVMKLMDFMCRDPLMAYSSEKAPVYLGILEANIEQCSIGKDHLNITLNPNFFTQNYEIVKNIFPSTAWQLRNRSFKNCYIHCGSYSLELPGASPHFGGVIKKGEETVSITDGNLRAEYGNAMLFPKSNGTSTTSGREFMELVRMENKNAIARKTDDVIIRLKERLPAKN